MYTRDCVALLGDAAHATSPRQGQGTGQASEDALAISSVLAKVQIPKQIPNAFMAYNQVRRPRRQRIIESNRDIRNLLSMKADGVGDDLETMAQQLNTCCNWIWQRDMSAQTKEIT